MCSLIVNVVSTNIRNIRRLLRFGNIAPLQRRAENVESWVRVRSGTMREARSVQCRFIVYLLGHRGVLVSPSLCQKAGRFRIPCCVWVAVARRYNPFPIYERPGMSSGEGGFFFSMSRKSPGRGKV